MVNEKYIVEGFEFTSEHEVNKAKSEVRGINYVVSNTDMNDPKKVLIVFNRLIDKKIFKTPIGIKFLKEMQDMLLANNEIDEELIKPIPAFAEVEETERTKSENFSDKKKKKKNRLSYRKKMINSIIINVILILVIIFMFIITGNSKNINIINYENRIKDQYSSWEEQLNERESSLDERESSLNSQE